MPSGCLDPDAPGNLVPATVVDNPSLPAIEIADTRLHAESFGDPGDPMIMVLHGGPGSDYRAMLPLRALANDGFFLVFWDQRGAGLSQRHDASSYSLEGYLEDLRLVLEHYTNAPDQPVVFIGHSWGAMYATWFIDEYGDYDGRVRGAILSEPGAFTDEQLGPYFERLLGSVRYFGEVANDVTWADQFISPAEHARADYAVAMRAAQGRPAEHYDPDNPAPSWRPGAVVLDALLSLAQEDGFDWTQNLASFPGKVLFLRGELNEAATLEHQQELAASYADSEIVTIAGVGHEMIWERPDAYLQHTRAYLAELGLPGGAR